MLCLPFVSPSRLPVLPRVALALWAAGIATVLGPGLGWAQAPDWTFDPARYETTLTATLAVSVDGVPIDSADVVGAFVGGDVRGTARRAPATAASASDLVFLTVYGDAAGPTVTLRVYDASADSVREASRTLAFVPDATYGTPTSPFRVAIGEADLPRVENWTVTPANYEQTMTLTTTVFVKPYNEEADGPGDQLAAFVDGTVRGVARSEAVAGGRMFFLTVYGNPGDAGRAITLRYYDAATDRVFPVTAHAMVFQSNGVEGTPRNPVAAVAVRQAVEVEGTLRLGGIAPHPLDRDALIEFASDRNVRVRLVLYDLMGRRVRHLYHGPVEKGRLYRARLRVGALASGTYLLRLRGPRGQTTRRVVVVH